MNLFLSTNRKSENAVEVQRGFRREFQKKITLTRMREVFEAQPSLQNVHKKCSGTPRTSPCPIQRESVSRNVSAEFNKIFIAREIELPKSIVHPILKRCPWTSHITRIVHILNKDNPVERLDFCE